MTECSSLTHMFAGAGVAAWAMFIVYSVWVVVDHAG